MPLITEKAMAPHSSTLAGQIPWTEEPGGLQSMGSLRVGHDWVTSLSLFTFMRWRRKWQPTPVFLSGESQGRWSLVGCRLWGRTELDTAEAVKKVIEETKELVYVYSQLFVSPPQTIIWPFCISFPWGWSWSLPPVQCHEPPSIVLQALSIRSNPLNLFHCIIVRDLI